MTTQPDISVVVAAYNEESVIAGSIMAIRAALLENPEIAWEIVVVDDGSRDRTGEILTGLAQGDSRIIICRHRRNHGQGRALRTAFEKCAGKTVVTLDADLSYGPEYIFSLKSALERENADIALASAYAAGGTVENVPLYRRVLSRNANRYLSLMSPYPVSTFTCVVRAYRKDCLEGLFLTSDGPEILIEILSKARLANMTVCEIPAHLAWPDSKKAGARRISSMKILRAIRLYLLMGWLTRPAFAFMLAALPLLGAGLYMGVMLAFRGLTLVHSHLSEGFFQAISSGLRELFTTYTYSVVLDRKSVV